MEINNVPSLIESGIAEFEKEFPRPMGNYKNVIVSYSKLEKYIASFATNVHNNAIESALEPIEKGMKIAMSHDARCSVHIGGICECGAISVHQALSSIRAKLSALKEENV